MDFAVKFSTRPSCNAGRGLYCWVLARENGYGQKSVWIRFGKFSTLQAAWEAGQKYSADHGGQEVYVAGHDENFSAFDGCQVDARSFPVWCSHNGYNPKRGGRREFEGDYW